VSAPSFEAEDGLDLWPLRSPTLPPATHTNCWLLGRDDLTVVDPGTPWTEELEALLEALQDRKITRIFLTHHHHDHVSGALAIQSRTGAPIACHPLTASRVSFEVQELYEDGDLLPTQTTHWRLIHTPGHATGHLCLHDPNDGTVIAGDMVAGEGTILLEPDEGDLQAYLHSLSRLEALSPTRLLPAHGPVLDDAIGVLREYTSHRLMRTVQIVEALESLGAPATAVKLAPLVYTTISPSLYPLAALQMVCHLGWLRDHEILEETPKGTFALRDVGRLHTVISDRGWQA
jgi:ribonuclease/clavin/mitogillin